MSFEGPTPRQLVDALRVAADQLQRYAAGEDGLQWPPSNIGADTIGGICRSAAEWIERHDEEVEAGPARRQGVLL
jgi:hypothetical protein